MEAKVGFWLYTVEILSMDPLSEPVHPDQGFINHLLGEDFFHKHVKIDCSLTLYI